MRVLISDLHLDPGLPAGLARFARFCTEVASAAGELWILGDLFELWVGDDADDAAATCVRRELRGLAERGTRCLIMHGNRDFLMGARLARDCGAELVADPTVITLATGPVVLSHGDALCTDDATYQALRRRLRGDAFRAEMLARPLDERRKLGDAAREQSRAANENKPEHIMDVNAEAVDALLDAHDADLLVHGHTHRPGAHAWTRGGRTRRRLVLGAWHEEGCVYARADDAGVELSAWA